jgi:membrane-bound lytic murein transglycosylase F
MPSRAAYWLLAALLPTLALAGIRDHVTHERWTEEYDHLFRKYTKHYFGAHFDWRWFKAQGIAESGLRPDAVSAVGARGIMQIMPATYDEIRRQVPFLADVSEPRWNIAAGIFYDRQLYRKWKRKGDIHTGERLQFAFASYNAGFGTMLKAHKRAQAGVGTVRTWRDVEPFAPGETRRYVARIHGLMQQTD